jgi:hypothetical protein
MIDRIRCVNISENILLKKTLQCMAIYKSEITIAKVRCAMFADNYTKEMY